MCGINGIFGLEDVPEPRELIGNMNRSLQHRGPDDEGVYEGNNIGLGHRRLSIIDLSDSGHQPMTSPDGRYVLVYNGEIYNYKKLKEELKDYPFQSETDSEVVLAAFLHWGKNCIKQFNGMFALAIYDTQEQELFLARDRMGIKPLYYHYGDKQFVFSSELRAVLNSGLVPRKLDKNGLVDYLRYQTVHAPHTIVKDVKMLMPGHYIRISGEEMNIREYWNMTRNSRPHAATESYGEIRKTIKDLFFDSVEKRMMADVPYGAFLSGGIDSSIVVGAMSEVASQPVKTFSVSFEEEEYSEAPYARMIAEKFNTHHTEIPLKAADLLDELPDALKAMDHPSSDGPNTYLVSKVTKEKGVTMALSGLGGDELFAGYDIFKRAVQLEDRRWVMSFPKGMRSLAGRAFRQFKPSIASDKIDSLLKQDYWDLNHTYPLSRQSFMNRQILDLLNVEVLPENQVFKIVTEAIGEGRPGYDLPFLSKVSCAEIHTYLQNVLLRDTDQMSMAHALEVRVPFLDHRLVEYALGIPDEMKYPTSPKKLLVDAMEGILPREVVDRPKMGFTFPWEEWLRGTLRPFAEEKLNGLGKRNIFNADQVEQLWTKFLQNDPRLNWSRIWNLIVLEDWLERNGITDE